MKLFNNDRLSAAILIALITTIILGGSIFYYRYESNQISQEKGRELKSIAELKKNQITQWQKERYSEANFFSTSKITVDTAYEILKGNKTKNDTALFNYLKPITSFDRYEDIFIVDPDGNLIFTMYEKQACDHLTLSFLKKATEKGEIYFTDLYYCDVHHNIRYDFMAPVSKDGKTIAWLVMRSNPEGYLFPLLEQWPIPRKTSESILLRRNGDNLEFISMLKDIDNKKLDFVLPITSTKISAYVISNKKSGLFEGIDYHNEKVFAYIDSIPGTPWMLKTKIDRDEILSELYYRAGFIILYGITLLLLCITGIVLMFRWKQKTMFQRLYLQEKEITSQQNEIVKLNKELEQRVKQRTQQLQDANKELESFSYTVSHDLRAPLRHIHGYLELLKRFTADIPEKGKRYMNQIFDSAGQMEKLIENLLEFSRTSRQQIRKTRFQMNDVLNEVLQLEKSTHSDRNITWMIDDLPEVTGDYSLIRQVWHNLISNAVKFTRHREEAIIEIGYKENELSNEFFIKDNGAGFDMKYAQKLFSVFYRMHSDEEFEGTGIGLATVMRIIAKHDGHVSADAIPEQGATFTFTLPKNPE